jgi:hypothetical protein
MVIEYQLLRSVMWAISSNTPATACKDWGEVGDKSTSQETRQCPSIDSKLDILMQVTHMKFDVLTAVNIK